MAPQFPPPDPGEEYVASNTRLPRKLWERLERIAKAEKKSRAAVVEFFLTWAADDYESAQKPSKR